ncbi:MAG TPA: hypothetical protein VGG28_17275 [Kofleriaceae bacterium]
MLALLALGGVAHAESAADEVAPSHVSASVAATLGRDEGVRVDVDAIAWGHLVIGAVVIAQAGAVGQVPDRRDLDAFATLGYEHDLLGWHLRATVGAGLHVTYVEDPSSISRRPRSRCRRASR